MKSIFCIILCLICLSSCQRKAYTDTAECKSLGDGIISAIDDGQEYLDHDGTHTKLYFEDIEEYDDCRIMYSADTNDINEIGIFHAPSAKMAAELEESCREYISDVKEDSRSFIASYAPEELTKLDGAQVRRFGSYVVYTVLPSDKAESVFSHLEHTLAK